MSFQLIYTSAEHLLDSSVSGYGTVARSEALSKTLRARLSAISVYREPRPAPAPQGPQFSYHLIDHAGTTWHVLTCAQPAGADYSGRGCFVAHHLVLSAEEIRQLLKSELRPTPAGVMLALHHSGFWCRRWQGPPSFLEGEPELSPADLPDAAAQPTWKRLTGHKANARAFYTPPFERDCLITVPAGTVALDILRLFHESDWLTHTRGWGVSFTTVADEADNFADTLRMVTIEGSNLVQRAMRTGHPVLAIDSDMELPLPEPTREPPTSEPMHPDATAAQHGSMMRTLSRSVSHYHYTEEPDWLMYDVAPARSALVPGTLLAAGAAACLALGIWYYWDAAAGIAPEDELVQASSPDGATDPLLNFCDLLRNAYDHSETQRILGNIVSQEVDKVEDALLKETATLILQSQQTGTSHPAAIKRLCECARLLGLNEIELVRLYLKEATYQLAPEEWQKQFDGQQLAAWLVLKQNEPRIVNVMRDGILKDYAPVGPAEPAQTTILATAEPAPDTPDDSSVPAESLGRVAISPAATVSGKELPEVLERIIPQLPVSVTTGTYVVSTYAKGGTLQEPQRLELSPDGYHLYITPTERNGEFLIKPEHKDGKASPVPAASFIVRAGRLQQVLCDGQEAVICFPVPSDEDFHTNTVLASSFGIPIPTGKGLTLPPAAQAQLEITPADLEITAAKSSGQAPRVQLRPRDKFPWKLNRRNVENIRFTVTLPNMSGHNAILVADDTVRSYVWKGAVLSKETESMASLRCEIEHRPDLPGWLERAFERVMNSPCCGEVESHNQAMTLGNLYYICCALDSDKLSRSEKRQLHQAYFALFAHKAFNKVLMRVFAQDTSLHLTPEEASSGKIKAIQLRRKIKNTLDNRAIRDLIRRRVCEVLTRTMYAAYTQEQQTVEKDDKSHTLLILKDITIGKHIELIWQFEMQRRDK